MIVQFNVRDFLDRAEAAYPDRIGLVDEPDQPAEPWEPLTFAELAARARAQAAGLDRLGVGPGERVAIVSHNSARLLTSFFGVSRLGPDAGADQLPAGPGRGRVHRRALGRLGAAGRPRARRDAGRHRRPRTASCSAPTSRRRAATSRRRRAAVPWAPDEDATATINYTSGTTARPKGVQLTHRNCWVNATVFGWHMQVSRPRRLPPHPADVPLQRLGHALRPPRAWAGTQVVLRKVDGAEILRRVERHGVTLLCAAPAVVNAVLDAAPRVGRPIPGRDRMRIVVAGAPPPSRTIERVESELGWEFIQIYGLTETSPLLTINRHRAEWDDLDPGRAGPEAHAGRGPGRRDRLRVDERRRGAGPVQHGDRRGTGTSPRRRRRALAGGWFHTGDGGVIDEEGYLSILDRKKDVIITGGENVSSIEVEDAVFSLHGVAEVAVIGVPDEQVGRDGHRARGAGRRQRRSPRRT